LKLWYLLFNCKPSFRAIYLILSKLQIFFFIKLLVFNFVIWVFRSIGLRFLIHTLVAGLLTIFFMFILSYFEIIWKLLLITDFHIRFVYRSWVYYLWIFWFTKKELLFDIPCLRIFINFWFIFFLFMLLFVWNLFILFEIGFKSYFLSLFFNWIVNYIFFSLWF
jgi:hypothetical protein